MSDAAVLVFVVLTFAVLVTAHVAIVFGLARHEPRWHAAVAFFVPPLAPYWGFGARMRARSIVWCVAFALYVIARVVARS